MQNLGERQGNERKNVYDLDYSFDWLLYTVNI